jgi:hypothetical protein
MNSSIVRIVRVQRSQEHSAKAPEAFGKGVQGKPLPGGQAGEPGRLSHIPWFSPIPYKVG